MCGCVRAQTYRIHHATICLRPAQLPATSIVLLVVHPIHRIRSAPEMCCRCVHVREYARARAYANAVHGAGGAPRQAQVLTAGAGMASPAGAHSCRQDCKFRQDCNCCTAIAFSCPQWTPPPAGGAAGAMSRAASRGRKRTSFFPPPSRPCTYVLYAPFLTPFLTHPLEYTPPASALCVGALYRPCISGPGRPPLTVGLPAVSLVSSGTLM